MKAKKVSAEVSQKIAKQSKAAPTIAKKPIQFLGSIKHVASNGQISFGKAYAGKMIQILKVDEDTFTIKIGRFIPDNEIRIYEGDNLQQLRDGIDWANKTPRSDNFEEIKTMIERG
jgi:hypothetical protein